MQRTAIKIASVVFFLTLVATAQESRSEIGVQGMGLFTQNSSGNSVTQSATDHERSQPIPIAPRAALLAVLYFPGHFCAELEVEPFVID